MVVYVVFLTNCHLCFQFGQFRFLISLRSNDYFCELASKDVYIPFSVSSIAPHAPRPLRYFPDTYPIHTRHIPDTYVYPMNTPRIPHVYPVNTPSIGEKKEYPSEQSSMIEKGGIKRGLPCGSPPIVFRSYILNYWIIPNLGFDRFVGSKLLDLMGQELSSASPRRYDDPLYGTQCIHDHPQSIQRY